VILRIFVVSIVLVMLGGTVAARAQEPAFEDSSLAVLTVLEDRSAKIAAYPYAFYTPETELAVGAGGIVTFFTSKEEADLRPSKVGFGGYYSTRKQYKISQTTQLFLDRNRWFLLVPLEFGSFVDKYWGVGNTQPDIPEVDYKLDAFTGRIVLEGPSPVPFVLRDGFVYEFTHRDITDTLGNPNLDSTVLGYEGGLTSGLGVDLVRDSRDHIFWPEAGAYHRLTFLWFDGFLGSDYDYLEWELDLRRFQKLSEGQVLAFHFHGHAVGSGAPFYELPALGGGNIMRGYFRGRYRDRYSLAFQVEYRRPLWWRLGAVLFAGGGDVFGSEGSELTWDSLKYSYGVGLRFLFNSRDRINLRADFGFGQDTSGVYFGLEEAF